MTAPTEGSVLIVYAGFFQRGLGVSQSTRQIATGARKMGLVPLMLSLEDLPLPVRYLPHLVQKICNLFYSPSGYWLRQQLLRYLFLRYVQRILRTNDVLCVIYQDVYIARRLPVPAVASLHAIWSDNVQAHELSEGRTAKTRAWDARAIDRCTIPIAAVSSAYRESVLNDVQPYLRTVPKIDIVPLGVDVTQFHAPKRLMTPIHLGFAGRLEARKNPLFLIPVLRRLREADLLECDLTIVGSGPLETALRELAERERVDEWVHFTGALTHAEIPAQLAKLHLLLLPSLKESFSFVLLEAKLAGARTLVTKGMDVPREFCDVELPLDVAEWASRIVELAREASRSGSWTVPDTAGLRERYSVERYARGLMEAAGASIPEEDAGESTPPDSERSPG